MRRLGDLGLFQNPPVFGYSPPISHLETVYIEATANGRALSTAGYGSPDSLRPSLTYLQDVINGLRGGVPLPAAGLPGPVRVQHWGTSLRLPHPARSVVTRRRRSAAPSQCVEPDRASTQVSRPSPRDDAAVLVYSHRGASLRQLPVEAAVPPRIGVSADRAIRHGAVANSTRVCRMRRLHGMWRCKPNPATHDARMDGRKTGSRDPQLETAAAAFSPSGRLV